MIGRLIRVVTGGGGSTLDTARGDSWLLRALGGGGASTAGETVTPTTAMSLSAYYAAVRNISEDVGKLPFRVYRALEGGGRVLASDLPAAALLYSAPNREMTAITFREVITAHALGWGNGYAEIVRNMLGDPVALYPIHPQFVQAVRTDDGGIAYRVTMPKHPYHEVPAEDMLHVKGLGPDGLVGWSVARFAAECLGAAIAAQKFAGSFYGNGSVAGGVLEHPRALTPEARKNLRASWEGLHRGAAKANRIAILEEGMKFNAISVNPRDAQFIEGRAFQILEIARWFRIPPHMIGDLSRATFSNIEEMGISYVNDTLMPWLVRWEQECTRKLLPAREGAFAKFTVQALMRGNAVARADYYTRLFNMGALTINEIRGLEEINPMGAAGDEHFMQVNMTTVDRIVNGSPQIDTGAGALASARELPIADDSALVSALDITPVVEAVVARVAAKERLAVARAIKRAEAGTGDAADW